MPPEMTSSAQQDESAVAAVRRGDAERYRELVERHERRVFAVAWSRLGDAALAEEAAQEAFIRGYRRLWLLGDGAKFAAWITTIARHAAINLGLRHRRELNKRERWALEQAPPASADESPEICPPETLRQTLAELPDSHRECLVLFYLEGKGGAEAAATLGISEAALRVRLHRARAALRERLEEKLEGSLANLRPAKTLVPAVMAAVLVSSSAKAAAGGAVAVGVGAKFLSGLGKSLLFAWVLPLILLILTLPNLLVMSVIGRMERKNFRDADGFRPELHQHFFRSFIRGLPLAMVILAIITQSVLAAFGIKGYQLFIVGCYLVGLPLILGRSLTICRNQFQIGLFAFCLIGGVGSSAQALGWIPFSLVLLPLFIAALFALWIFKFRPARMDYSLFLRAAHGLLKFPDDADSEPQPKRFDRRSLLAFARFLGSRFLVYNFRWETNGLVLRLPPVENWFWTGVASVVMPPISQNCSHVSLGYDGTVMAHCGKNDLRDLSALTTSRMNDPQELECVVAEIVGQAWREFRGGKFPAAERTLGESPESEVFIVPPARAKSVRWWRIWIGSAAVLIAAAMIVQLSMPKHPQSSSRWKHQGLRLEPVELTEAQVRYSLEQKANFTNSTDFAKIGDMQIPFQTLVLAPTNLMSAKTMEKMRALFLTDPDLGESNSSARAVYFLDARWLQTAVVNGWLNLAQLGLSEQIIRQTIASASTEHKQRWFELNPARAFKGFTGLPTDDLAPRVQCLDKLGCLDAMEDKSVAETLLQNQILTEQSPPGRRPLSDARPLHGLFFTSSSDPIRDTYDSLVVLEKLGRLNQVDREACIAGILRFHSGDGLIVWPNKDPHLIFFGDARDTFAAFESLRILGALDRVKDLDKWKFRPFMATRTPADGGPRIANWFEIEAWVCQQRLEKILREHKANPSATYRSLLEP